MEQTFQLFMPFQLLSHSAGGSCVIMASFQLEVWSKACEASGVLGYIFVPMCLWPAFQQRQREVDLKMTLKPAVNKSE